MFRPSWLGYLRCRAHVKGHCSPFWEPGTGFSQGVKYWVKLDQDAVLLLKFLSFGSVQLEWPDG